MANKGFFKRKNFSDNPDFVIDYKDTKFLSRYISGKRQNYAEPHYERNRKNPEGNCPRHQTRPLCCPPAVCC